MITEMYGLTDYDGTCCKMDSQNIAISPGDSDFMLTKASDRMDISKEYEP